MELPVLSQQDATSKTSLLGLLNRTSLVTIYIYRMFKISTPLEHSWLFSLGRQTGGVAGGVAGGMVQGTWVGANKV